MDPASQRDDPKFARVRRLGSAQGAVVSRRQLYALGVTRWEVRARVRTQAWTTIGDQSVQLHSGPRQPDGLLWAAVFQAGPRALLDGDSALVAAGLKRWQMGRIRVSVPRGARVRRTRDFNIRQTRRWDPDDTVGTGPPRTRVAVAAVRAGLWARSNREASLVLTMVVQQGLAHPAEIAGELLRIRRDKRRLLLHALVNDLLDGARALGELDVIRELRRRGIPRPDQQVMRKDGSSRYFLDMCWKGYGVVVEVDGIHHAWAENVVGDALRQNSLVMQGAVVLRLPLLGLRIAPDEFFQQIRNALLAGGWCPSERHPSQSN